MTSATLDQASSLREHLKSESLETLRPRPVRELRFPGLTPGEDEASDCLQAAALNALEREESLDRDRNPRSWLCATALIVAHPRRRRTSLRMAGLESRPEQPEESVTEGDRTSPA